jgi:hypothetical protein
MIDLDEFREYAAARGLTVYQLPHGLGVRFQDGCDVYWVLPEEQWHFLNANRETISVSTLRVLDERRNRVVDAIRRYLATQKIPTERTPNGRWSLLKGHMSTELCVGANLTRVCTETKDLVAIIQSVFQGSTVKRLSQRRAERHLGEFGELLHEPPWPEGAAVIELPQTPFTALGWMGLCKALQKETSFESAEAFAAAVEPKGRVGRALLQVAHRLPKVKASVEFNSGAMCLEFSDEHDSFEIKPKSRELHDLLRRMEPAAAGDYLADEYERLNAGRQQVLNSVFTVLQQRGYSIDPYENIVGRELREFSLNLGKDLTTAVREQGLKQAVKVMLGERSELADEIINRMDTPVGVVKLVERQLKPVAPTPMELPTISEARMKLLDERCRAILSNFVKTTDALRAYCNRLMWDPTIDMWASSQEWQALARDHMEGEYPRSDAVVILIDYGDRAVEAWFVESLRTMEPHHEVGEQVIEMVWRQRHSMPDVAAKWFAAELYDDVPFAEERARLGDPIATCFRLNGISSTDDGEVPELLASVVPEILSCFVTEAQLAQWRAAASEWAKDEWNWESGGSRKTLEVAANMGWTEIGDALMKNPFLLPGLLRPSDGNAGLLFAGDLALAWSKLCPSRFLRDLVGYGLEMDLDARAESLAQRSMGSSALMLGRPQMITEIANSWTSTTLVALAIAWHRCRQTELS